MNSSRKSESLNNTTQLSASNSNTVHDSSLYPFPKNTIGNSKEICATNYTTHKRKRTNTSLNDKELMEEKEQPYIKKLRERVVTNPQPLNGINCHHCSSVQLVKKMKICSVETCHESYCYKCIKSFYSPENKDKQLAINTTIRNWKCFKCQGQCKCQKCNHTKRLSVNSISQQKRKNSQVSVNLHSLASQKVNENIKPKSTKTIFNINQKSQVNEPCLEIFKLKDEALITSLFTTPILSTTKKKKSKKKKDDEDVTLSQNPIKRKVKPNEKLSDSRLKEIAHICENHFSEVNKNRLLLKKECIKCHQHYFNINEILYFRFLRDFLGYVAYLNKTQKDIICYNTTVYEGNYDYLSKSLDDMSILKDNLQWYFSKPKIICKGCLMSLLNKEDCADLLIQYFSDTKSKEKSAEEIADFQNIMKSSYAPLPQKMDPIKQQTKTNTEEHNELVNKDKEIQKERQKEIEEVKEKRKELEKEAMNITNSNIFDQVFKENEIKLGNIQGVSLQIQCMNQKKSNQESNSIKDQEIIQDSSSVLQSQEHLNCYNYLNNELMQSIIQLAFEAYSLNQHLKYNGLKKEELTIYYRKTTQSVNHNIAIGKILIHAICQFKKDLIAYSNYLFAIDNNNESLKNNLDKEINEYVIECKEYDNLSNYYMNIIILFETKCNEYLSEIRKQLVLLDYLSLSNDIRIRSQFNFI